MTSSPNIPAPQQLRSSETLARIITAARELIEEQPFETVTMNQIAERAGVSVGNLYNRFANKDALLSHILDELQALQAHALRESFTPEAAELPLGEKVAKLVSGSDAGIRENRGTIRAVVLRYAMEADKLSEEQKRASADMVNTVARWLGSGTEEIAHADPELACRMAAMVAAIVFQYSTLIDTAPRMFGADVFVTELERMLAAYLGVNEEKTATEKRTKK